FRCPWRAPRQRSTRQDAGDGKPSEPWSIPWQRQRKVVTITLWAAMVRGCAILESHSHKGLLIMGELDDASKCPTEVQPNLATRIISYFRGHPKGFWFFFWGEFAERCCYYGMRAILALYMVERLGIREDDVGTFMSLFIAGCYFLPLLGGF